MQPITRETILDRRQPMIRWAAVFAGTAFSVAVWVVLQLLGLGIGLIAMQTDAAGNLRGVGLGTSLWSLIAPIVAVFVGSWLAGRLATTRERGVGAMHGMVVWAMTAVFGTLLIVRMVAMVAIGAARVGYDEGFVPPSGHEAVHVAEATGQAMLVVGVALLVGLVAAAAGGALGLRRERAARTITTQPPVVPPTTTIIEHQTVLP